ncbi:ATP-dependent DNA ligase [Nocardioides szechwanensis]|uniref:DNA ligase (ATP) n=1 Tax=Nocardioides szechwanensis TaxID=1005944 RepID=A0A1H0ANZ9_9ACTN|nr:non-homologous end-joining DNA ligase [Nocardioides szechwanensis]GEP34795.1 ATP-dependent DNA ligase [Nocardioides szechwanensis]SDN35270.1 bifunctional non-homologous end joining protein LigD [Nocardioides szechwanensis]
MRPMLATKGTHVPTGAEWSHEVKWDGVRILAEARGSDVRLYTRNGNDATVAWPELIRSEAAARDLAVDGEVIALNDRGIPDFRMLRDRMHLRRPADVARLALETPATFMVFDLLRLDGRDLTSLPLEERRALLTGLDLGGSAWQVPASYDDGAMLFDATLQQGLEGIVSKRRSSRYRPGERSREWLKFAHRHRHSYVIGGWRPQEGTSDRLAAVLVGEQTAEGLLYRGRVGSGIGGKVSAQLAELLAPLARADSPFSDEVPRVDALGTRWVEPRIVIDVDTHGVGYTRLRQPSYQGVRHDLVAEDL